MNFLSHFYLHRDYSDNCFTVGLTMPDVLGFHTQGARVHEKFLRMQATIEHDTCTLSLIKGMVIHLSIDKWFHGLTLFREAITKVQDLYQTFSKGRENFSHFFSHVLVEILIDRYLLSIEPDLADKFYESYKTFDFTCVVPFLSKIKNFNEGRFLSLTDKMKTSTFLNDYIDSNAIVGILHRVAGRKNFVASFQLSDSQLAEYFDRCYNDLHDDIITIIEYSRAKFPKNLGEYIMEK